LSGFIYVWYDKKHHRYYVGSHWGTDDDGYICSSDNMKHNYRNRPYDFKRRIVKYIQTNRQDLLDEEQRWLNMIKPNEFGFRYYNISSSVKGPYWWMNEKTKQEVIAKVSASRKGQPSNWKGKTASPETRAKQSAAKLGKPSPRKGKQLQWINNNEQDKLIPRNESIPYGWTKGRLYRGQFHGNQYVTSESING
jgi:hypothetical protein